MSQKKQQKKEEEEEEEEQQEEENPVSLCQMSFISISFTYFTVKEPELSRQHFILPGK